MKVFLTTFYKTGEDTTVQKSYDDIQLAINRLMNDVGIVVPKIIAEILNNIKVEAEQE